MLGTCSSSWARWSGVVKVVVMGRAVFIVRLLVEQVVVSSNFVRWRWTPAEVWSLFWLEETVGRQRLAAELKNPAAWSAIRPPLATSDRSDGGRNWGLLAEMVRRVR